MMLTLEMTINKSSSNRSWHTNRKSSCKEMKSKKRSIKKLRMKNRLAKVIKH